MTAPPRRNILVTGAAAGLGLAITRRLLRQGFGVYVFTGYPRCAEQRQGVMLTEPEVSLVS